MTVPGIGPLIASAMVAAIGNGIAFAKGRDFAAWLGLVPKQMSTGDRTILGRISKRGDVYLRCLLTHGARAVLLTAQRTLHATRQGTRFQHWAVALAARRGHNKAAIAVANKLARMVWAVWRKERDFNAGPRVAVAA